MWLPSADAQLLQHAHQLGNRASFHLAHGLRSPDFDGDFADIQLSRDLLVEHASHHANQHRLLPTGQRIPTRTQLQQLPILRATLAIKGNTLLYGIQQVLIAKRLGQKLYGPGLHGLHAHGR